MVNCLTRRLKGFKSNDTKILAVKECLLSAVNKRFGLAEQNSKIAMSTILDPRFKTINFKNPIACSRAIAKLRTLCAAEQSSEESEEDLSSSESDNSLYFWQTHKELAHGKRKKKQGYSGDSSEITICRSFQPGRAGQSGLRVNEEANQLDVDSDADLFNVDEQANQA
ncbi:hypothetical protein J6590_069592 [Homalodisca vitripennis]|nr:hypothetical protein J6590_069592 [Homalodisca vitripennis]